MRQQLIHPAIVALLAGLLGYTWAQRPTAGDEAGKRPEDLRIGVVDLGKVFLGYQRLGERREEHARETQKVDAALKELFAEIGRLKDDLKRAKEGSAEQRRLVEEAQTKAREFELQRQKEQQRLMLRETEIYAQAYARVVEEIQKIAEARGLRLVLRTQAGPLEGKNPQETLAGLNRAVLYQESLDITDQVLEAMN